MTLRLGIGIPAYGSKVVAMHTVMWAQLGAAAARDPDHVQIVMFGHVDTCGVDRARNALVRQAMIARADWLLMVDADTFAVSGKDLLRMILERPMGAAAVGAPVIRRGDAMKSPNVWRWTGERYESRTAIFNHGTSPFIEVDAIGAAILAVNLISIAAHHAEFRWADGMSEDLYFCRQLRKAGETIYADARVATVHLGQPEILTYGGV